MRRKVWDQAFKCIVYKVEHDICGAETLVKWSNLYLLGIGLSNKSHHLWICFAKTIDRLLFIANDKQTGIGAWRDVHGFTSKKVVRDFFKHRPLEDTGVLKLIEHQMMNRARQQIFYA